MSTPTTTTPAAIATATALATDIMAATIIETADGGAPTNPNPKHNAVLALAKDKLEKMVAEHFELCRPHLSNTDNVYLQGLIAKHWDNLSANLSTIIDETWIDRFLDHGEDIWPKVFARVWMCWMCALNLQHQYFNTVPTFTSSAFTVTWTYKDRVLEIVYTCNQNPWYTQSCTVPHIDSIVPQLATELTTMSHIVCDSAMNRRLRDLSVAMHNWHKNRTSENTCILADLMYLFATESFTDNYACRHARALLAAYADLLPTTYVPTSSKFDDVRVRRLLNELCDHIKKEKYDHENEPMWSVGAWSSHAMLHAMYFVVQEVAKRDEMLPPGHETDLALCDKFLEHCTEGSTAATMRELVEVFRQFM